MSIYSQNEYVPICLIVTEYLFINPLIKWVDLYT
jgi:hypothetical protein